MNILKDFPLIPFIFGFTVMSLFIIWRRAPDFQTKDAENTKVNLFYPEGRAILSSGRVCIINTAALESEELALKMTKACVDEYKKQSANPQ